MWAWNNPSIEPALAADARRVLKYGTERGIAKLTFPKWRATEVDAWAMTAVANRICESNGAYRGPAGSTYVFMTFGVVQICKENN
jgi:hypothetical protein